ncbi:MAG: hypothetical protein SV765_18870 [Pseudomonadota bacterium]|nr:hypothetical protein [Pseudomonadales bacterium]MDY6922268.1 hypothetical protein [Pseudomonadota bacterium]
MMVRTLVCSGLLWLTMTATAATDPAPEQSSRPANADPAQQVARLIRLTGLQQQLQYIPQALRETANAPDNPTGSLLKPLLQQLMQVFDPKEMLAILSTDLLQRLDVSTLLDALQWYRSTDGQALVRAQQQAASPAVLEKTTAVLESQQPAISNQRQVLIREMIQASRADAMALDLMVNLQAAFTSGLGNMIAPAQTPDFARLHEQFAGTREQLAPQLQHQLLLQQSVALEQLSDATLASFVQFARSGSGQRLFQALRAAMDHTVQTMARRIPQQIQSSRAAPAP